MHPRWCTQGDALKVMHPRWCTQGDAPKVLHLRWCTQGDALKVMHSRWCTQGDALKVMHSRWCTQGNAPKVMHPRWCISLSSFVVNDFVVDDVDWNAVLKKLIFFCLATRTTLFCKMVEAEIEWLVCSRSSLPHLPVPTLNVTPGRLRWPAVACLAPVNHTVGPDTTPRRRVDHGSHRHGAVRRPHRHTSSGLASPRVEGKSLAQLAASSSAWPQSWPHRPQRGLGIRHSIVSHCAGKKAMSSKLRASKTLCLVATYLFYLLHACLPPRRFAGPPVPRFTGTREGGEGGRATCTNEIGRVLFPFGWFLFFVAEWLARSGLLLRWSITEFSKCCDASFKKRIFGMSKRRWLVRLFAWLSRWNHYSIQSPCSWLQFWIVPLAVFVLSFGWATCGGPRAVDHSRWTTCGGLLAVDHSRWTTRGGLLVLDHSRWATRVGPLAVGHSCWTTRGGPLAVDRSRWATRVGPLVVDHSWWTTRGEPLAVDHSRWVTSAGPSEWSVSNVSPILTRLPVDLLHVSLICYE